MVRPESKKGELLKRPQRKGKRAAKSSTRKVPALPMPLHATDCVPFHRRFLVASKATSNSVTRQFLASALGGICSVTNSVHTSWASSCRIRSITIWPAAGSQAALNWATSSAEQALQRDDFIIDTMPTGITVDKPVRVVPNKKSYLSMWQALGSNSTDPLFQVSAELGSIIDVEGVYTLTNDYVAPNTTIAAGTLGVVYYLALDGPSSNKIQPLGLPTTA